MRKSPDKKILILDRTLKYISSGELKTSAANKVAEEFKSSVGGSLVHPVTILRWYNKSVACKSIKHFFEFSKSVGRPLKVQPEVQRKAIARFKSFCEDPVICDPSANTLKWILDSEFNIHVSLKTCVLMLHKSGFSFRKIPFNLRKTANKHSIQRLKEFKRY